MRNEPSQLGRQDAAPASGPQTGGGQPEVLMTPAVRQLFRAYVGRRSPWGPPWWIYGVAYGVLNLIRQAVIGLAAPELSTPGRVTSWAATALIVIGGVNTVDVARRRCSKRSHTGTARVHETAHPDMGPKKEAA